MSDVKFNWNLDDDGFEVAEVQYDDLQGPVTAMIDFSEIEDNEGSYGLWVTVNDPVTDEEVDFFTSSSKFTGDYSSPEDIRAHHNKVKDEVEQLVTKVLNNRSTADLVKAGFQSQQSVEIVKNF